MDQRSGVEDHGLLRARGHWPGGKTLHIRYRPHRRRAWAERPPLRGLRAVVGGTAHCGCPSRTKHLGVLRDESTPAEGCRRIEEWTLDVDDHRRGSPHQAEDASQRSTQWVRGVKSDRLRPLEAPEDESSPYGEGDEPKPGPPPERSDADACIFANRLGHGPPPRAAAHHKGHIGRPHGPTLDRGEVDLVRTERQRPSVGGNDDLVQRIAHRTKSEVVARSRVPPASQRAAAIAATTAWPMASGTTP
ncbi:MAG: hypothetical protein QOF60_2392 [Actinomycetota bacterium]|nr:hypothetical protein [Actinomycetota bacterium]